MPISYKFIKFALQNYKKNYSMKKLVKVLSVFVMIFSVSTMLAQDKNNKWQFGIGVNAIDFHPVGTDSSDNSTVDCLASISISTKTGTHHQAL